MVGYEADVEWREKRAKDKALGGPNTHRVRGGRWFRADRKRNERSPEEGHNTEASETQHFKDSS